MKAVRVVEHGGPEVLRLEEVPEPACGPDDVLADVRATAVNRADLLQRQGRYPAPPGAPSEVPGLEFAGVVREAGERVRGLEAGDRVMGLLGGGGYAERVATPAGMVLPIPPEMSFRQAAAVPEVFYTAYDALFRQGQLRVGESVLIHAAGGGVGTAALQLAGAGGASVIVGTASRAKLDGVAHLGLPLDVSVDYRERSFADAVAEATDGGGVNVILDTVGAAHWRQNVESLAPSGRLVLVGLLGGNSVEADLSALLTRRLRVVGTVLRSRSLGEKLTLTREVRRRVLPLLTNGRVRPVVDRTFPLEEAADAHRYMADDRNLGKIVLEV